MLSKEEYCQEYNLFDHLYRSKGSKVLPGHVTLLYNTFTSSIIIITFQREYPAVF